MMEMSDQADAAGPELTAERDGAGPEFSAQRDGAGPELSDQRVGAGPELTAEQLEFFEREADHFFRGEMAHEQRAAWLLALASALLVAVWRMLSSAYGEHMPRLAFALMIATLLALVTAVALSLWALWPLGGGKKPGLLRPWRNRHSSLDRTDGTYQTHPSGIPPLPRRFRVPIGDLVWYHYIAHRRRAEVKGRRVVEVTVALFVALFLGTAGILTSLLEPAW